ncbi:MAG: hypothetical protein HQM09_14830 [Candidatus Riflebacteria bacterium]|nr:hypothetical protein [Candidatus Riflebacteria bacterium]
MIECTTLLALQELDLALDESNREITRHQEKLDRFKAEVEKEEATAHQKEALLKKISLRQRQSESELADLTDRIRVTDMRLKTPGLTPNTYMALQNEVEKSRAALSPIETRVYEDMEKVEILSKDVEKAKKVAAGRRRQLEEVADKAAQTIRDCREKRELIRTQRNQTTLNVKTDLLEKYEEVRGKTKSKVVWDTDSAGCPSCGIRLPGGVISQLMASPNLAEQCPNCGIFMRWTGIPDGIVI